MRKTAILLVFTLFSFGANAQSLLKNLLDSTLTNKSITSIIENVVGGAVSKLDLSIEGTWKYSEPEVQFKSDNFLAQAGGAATTAKVEDKLKGIYSKIGFNESLTITFNADSTFAQTIKIGSSVKNLKGTYSLDKENKIVTLQYSALGNMKIGKVSAIYANTGTSLALLYDAGDIFSFLKKVVSTVSSISGKSSLALLSGVVDTYDGMLLGFKMNK